MFQNFEHFSLSVFKENVGCLAEIHIILVRIANMGCLTKPFGVATNVRNFCKSTIHRLNLYKLCRNRSGLMLHFGSWGLDIKNCDKYDTDMSGNERHSDNSRNGPQYQKG